jgi:predicted extracellular nuclease
LSDVSPAYDYVPASDAAYQARLNDIATQIINDLHSPDVLMVQEVENQDICTVSGSALVCGATDNADGKPDVLQELALKIGSLGGPAYDAAFDRNSSDLRGIAPAFLYRTDRVTLAPAANDPVLGATPQIGNYTSVPYDSDVSNPKTLNAPYTGSGACETSWIFPRAPDIALFRIYNQTAGIGGFHEVYVINNHFKSGPDSCVAHRTEQANYNAALVAFIQANNPQARIVVGGDLNVYPRPDDPFGPIVPQGTSSDQLGALYSSTIGLKNLWEVILAEHPEAAYSYVYLGMAQTLDQMFVNPLLLASLDQFRIAHINSDFPADYPGDVARGTSDHDPSAAVFAMGFHATGLFQPVDNQPQVNIAKAGSAIPVKFSLSGNQGLNIFAAGYPTSRKVTCDASAPPDAIEQTVNAGSSSLSYDATTDTYNYVWKTDKTWAGSCRQLTLVLVDGTMFEADFSFTK